MDWQPQEQGSKHAINGAATWVGKSLTFTTATTYRLADYRGIGGGGVVWKLWRWQEQGGRWLPVSFLSKSDWQRYAAMHGIAAATLADGARWAEKWIAEREKILALALDS